MTVPAVSVLMPVRDAADTLPEALESLIAQTDPQWELIAVDDGSADGSRVLLEGYARREPRIRVLAQPRRGVVAALCRGLGEVRAPLVARMDADDACLPERLACQRRHLEAHAAVGLVASRVRFAGAGRGYERHTAWSNELLTHDAISLGRFVESPLVHPSVMFRRELVARLGGYRDGDFPEDYELWLRWLEGGVRMQKLGELLLVWRDSPGRLSRRDPRYRSEAFFRMKAEYLARWLARANRHHPRVIVWGAGRVTRRRASELAAHGIEITAWVDIDPEKVGHAISGRPVLRPDALPPAGGCFVVSYVASVGARDRIASALSRLGYRLGVDCIMAA